MNAYIGQSEGGEGGLLDERADSSEYLDLGWLVGFIQCKKCLLWPQDRSLSHGMQVIWTMKKAREKDSLRGNKWCRHHNSCCRYLSIILGRSSSSPIGERACLQKSADDKRQP